MLSVLALSACSGKEAPKSGALPTIATAEYQPPTAQESTEAYLKGFEARYDIPYLDYPADIKARMKAARIEKLRNDKNLFELNVKLVKTAISSDELGKLTGRDGAIIKDLKNDLNTNDIETLMRGSHEKIELMAKIATQQKKKQKLSLQDRKDRYDSTVKAYPRRVISYSTDRCKWEPLKDLIYSGYKEMSRIHGEWPEKGFYCHTTLEVKTHGKYTREIDDYGFFAKSEKTGEWLYYGTYINVGVSPRRQQLNAEILENPERALKRLPFWEIDV